MGQKKKRAFLRNTVQGAGRKWDERTRTAAVCDMMVESNLSVVARRYGVPESTLRRWRDKAEKTESDMFAAARAAALRDLQYQAAQGAAAAVDTMRQQLDEDRRNREICRRARRALEDLGGVELVGEDGIRAGLPERTARGVLTQVMDDHRPISELTAGSMLRTLAAVQARTAEALRVQAEDEEADGFVIEFTDRAQEDGE